MDDASWAVIAQERLRLAELLAGLSPEQWEAQSLCTQWRVRDVAAHVAMTPTAPSTPELLRQLVRSRGNLWNAGAAIARAHAQRPTERIVAELREGATARTMPRFTTADNIFMDTLVHSQDIAIPLGIEHPMPAAAARTAFMHVWTMGWPFHARRTFRGARLVATDVDLSVGEGELLQGSVADLLLLVTGRSAVVAPRLRGPGTARVAA